jgi:hypothetical protein
MKRLQRNSERGIALLVALFALILIAAIGLGMMFSSDSELNVNSSYRQNQLAYYAARSGLEEARDRMRFTSAAGGISDFLPSVSIGQATDGTHPNPGVLYIIPNGSGIDPTDITSKYFDDELCHEINDTPNHLKVPNSPGTFNIKCPNNSNSLPQIAGWKVTKDSLSLGAGNGAIPYAWTRINRKLQESTSPWCVLGYATCNPQTGPDTLADQVCYDGSREFVLSDLTKPINVPGAVEGLSLPTEVALSMNMYFGANGQGNSGHSTTSTTGSSSAASSTSASGSGSVSSVSSVSSVTSVTTVGTTVGTTSATTGGGGSCSNMVYTPPAKPASYAAPSCGAANGQPVYTLSTLAITPGGARRMLQYEIAQILIPPVPSALTVAGPNPITSWPNSQPYHIIGTDAGTPANPACPAGHIPTDLPAIGTTTDVANGGLDPSAVATNAATGIASSLGKPDNFTGVDAGCSADVRNVINVAPSFNTVSGLNAVVQSVENSVTTPTGPFTTDQSWSGNNVGGSSATSVTVVNANLTLTGASHGYGILLVTGTLTMSGDYSWDGIILVIGKGEFIGSGGGGGQVNGAVVVAKIGNSSYINSPTDGNLLASLGSPTINMSGGGGNGLQYDSCKALTDPANVTFKVLARREITY